MNEFEPVHRGRDPHLAAVTETYEIDSSRSTATFHVKYLTGSITGAFTRMSGMLRFNPGDLSSTEARITVDARSVDTGEPERDRHLRSDGFLAVERYPEIVFVSGQADVVDGNVFELPGDLTMHGKTNPVMLQVTYLGMATTPDGRKQAVFDARAHVSRREFEMSLHEMLELGGLLVSDRIDLTFEIHASQPGIPG
jgi:polyisoprenoid-binding protein YceI